MRIESLRVQNYKALRDVRLDGIAPMAVLLGANGSGKSTLLDVFAFLQDCVRFGVRLAVDWRGGTHELFSRESAGNLTIEIQTRLRPEGRQLTYAVELIAKEDVAWVKREVLVGSPYKGRKRETLIDFTDTQGQIAADRGIEDPTQSYPMDPQMFATVDALALSSFGQLQRYATVGEFNRSIQEWACTPSMRRQWRTSLMGGLVSERAAETAELTQAVRNLEAGRRDRFDEVVGKLAHRVPGLKGVEAYETEDKRLLIRFSDGSFQDPFPLDAISEGTRRLLSLYLMLNEPQAPHLLTYEEPENDLYPQIVRPLAEEFRAYAERGSQVFVSTHSPDFVNGLELDELYWMEKRDGFARVVRAKDDPNLVAQHVEGELLGSLWREGMFGRADPL